MAAGRQARGVKAARGAARGEPLEWLLQTAARELVDAAGAVRAGVWLLRGASNLEGISLEVADETVPEQWMSVSLNSPGKLVIKPA